jgi:DNA-binding NtrC family response regulator
MQGEGAGSMLVVDDDAEFRGVVARRFRRRQYLVVEAGSGVDALRVAQEHRFNVAILDLAMPGMDGVALLERLRAMEPSLQVIMLTGHATLETAIRALKLGAFDYLTKPCELAHLEVQVQRAMETARLTQENQNLRTALQRVLPAPEILGASPAMSQVLQLIAKVAPSDGSVLILGESGTGKELVARALHQRSRRADKPLVVINCAALQESLLESELFGHEKGSFTSAVAAKQGLFEIADGGTLFIDEIGEMGIGVQAKLLRVAEDGTFRRVGSTKELRANVRIIAATNKKLGEEAAQGRFRPDLYYRLNVITIELPPLRERREDIPLLVKHFLQRSGPGPRAMDTEALEALLAYHWPGNIRELANVIERARILAEGPSITLHDLPPEVSLPAASPKAPAPPLDWSSPRLADLERQRLLQALAEAGGNKARAARALGVSRFRLYRLLQKHALTERHGDDGSNGSG